MRASQSMSLVAQHSVLVYRTLPAIHVCPDRKAPANRVQTVCKGIASKKFSGAFWNNSRGDPQRFL